MKKYIISGGIALVAATSVSAQTAQGTPQPTAPSREGGRPAMQMMMAAPVITTGDAATDAQIKALQQEMETKIKAIRDEYQAKIKTTIGDKKIIGRPLGNASTSPRGAMRAEMRDVHGDEGEGRARAGQKGDGRMMAEGNMKKDTEGSMPHEMNDDKKSSFMGGFFSKFFKN